MESSPRREALWSEICENDAPLHSGREAGARAANRAVRCSDGGEGLRGLAPFHLSSGDERVSVFADGRMTNMDL